MIFKITMLFPRENFVLYKSQKIKKKYFTSTQKIVLNKSYLQLYEYYANALKILNFIFS